MTTKGKAIATGVVLVVAGVTIGVLVMFAVKAIGEGLGNAMKEEDVRRAQAEQAAANATTNPNTPTRPSTETPGAVIQRQISRPLT